MRKEPGTGQVNAVGEWLSQDASIKDDTCPVYSYIVLTGLAQDKFMSHPRDRLLPWNLC